MRRPLLTILLVISALAGCGNTPAQAPATQPQSLPTMQVQIGQRLFTLEVADEPHEQEVGLMFRESMPVDRGMIFVFPNEQVRSFWMRNTLIPLDILYLDSDGRIVSIKTMKPKDETPISSEKRARYAIEVNAGVARGLGLKVGDRVFSPKRSN